MIFLQLSFQGLMLVWRGSSEENYHDHQTIVEVAQEMLACLVQHWIFFEGRRVAMLTLEDSLSFSENMFFIAHSSDSIEFFEDCS